MNADYAWLDEFHIILRLSPPCCCLPNPFHSTEPLAEHMALGRNLVGRSERAVLAQEATR